MSDPSEEEVMYQQFKNKLQMIKGSRNLLKYLCAVAIEGFGVL